LKLLKPVSIMIIELWTCIYDGNWVLDPMSSENGL